MFLLRTAPCLLLSALASSVSAYFVVTAPKLNDQWANGDTRLVAWTKGSQDGISSFDIEMSQLSADGLTLIAKNVPSLDSSEKSINILLQDVPPGDDYFLLFVNSTHGVMHATSQRFTVLAAGSSSNMSATTNAKAATVTVSGAPNPTQTFATTFALVSGAGRLLPTEQTLGVFGAVAACALGAAWTIVW